MPGSSSTTRIRSAPLAGLISTVSSMARDAGRTLSRRNVPFATPAQSWPPSASAASGDFLDQALDDALTAGAPHHLQVLQRPGRRVLELPLAVLEAAIAEAGRRASGVDQPAVLELTVRIALAVELQGLVVERGRRLHDVCLWLRA